MVHAGFSVEHWPLIHIEAASFGEGLERAIGQWARWRAVFFVSPQAVLYFFQHAQYARGALDLQQTRCWATGAGTREALLGQGVAADLIDTPNLNSGIWDSEHLWLEVQDQVRAHDQVLIVRGGEVSGASLVQDSEVHSASEQGATHKDRTGAGREYLAEHLRRQGAQVNWAVAYLRRVPQWSSAQVALAKQALCDGSVWILTSSQAVRNMQDLLGNDVASWSQGRAIATHDRIAQALSRAGFGVVRESRPNIESLLGSLESMQ